MDDDIELTQEESFNEDLEKKKWIELEKRKVNARQNFKNIKTTSADQRNFDEHDKYGFEAYFDRLMNNSMLKRKIVNDKTEMTNGSLSGVSTNKSYQSISEIDQQILTLLQGMMKADFPDSNEQIRIALKTPNFEID